MVLPVLTQEKVQLREDLQEYLLNLKKKIMGAFELLETGGTFQHKRWDYLQGEGGGESSILRGKIFEKAGVNWSGIKGDKYPLDNSQGHFYATGISLITHMSNPHAPTVHMNLRYIEAGARSWLGGGYDLTPMGFPYQEDTQHFHSIAKQSLDPFGESLYSEMSASAREYFFIKHRNKERGVGGIFFDYFRTDDFEKDVAMWKSIGDHFLDAIIPIYECRIHQGYTEQDRITQLALRAHYVEFNLLYDRGTKFGFQSGGNVEAILASLPPLCSW